MRTILFLCTGNTCRSPMAEAIARHLIDEGLLGERPDVFVASAGVAAASGVRPAREAVEALRELGIECSGTSKPLTPEMVRKAHLVLCMTSGHLATARAMVEGGGGPQIALLDPEADIDDPIGLDQEAYDALAQRLRSLIGARLKELLGHEDRTRNGPSGRRRRPGARRSSSKGRTRGPRRRRDDR